MEHQSTTEQVALVTGGARRIGAEIVRSLHAAGLAVAIHYRGSADAARALSDELNTARGDSATLLQADLDNPDSPRELIDQLLQWRDRLDLLVNNASSFFPTPLGEVELAQWDSLMNSNLRAPFFLVQAAADVLRQSRGCIINLVDIHAERPLARHPVYSMAKAANAMMVKSLARELGPEVRVNGVAPGVILWPEQPMDATAQQSILQRTALKRPGCPEDIARTVRFLALEAPYITGQILAVDGGRTLQQ